MKKLIAAYEQPQRQYHTLQHLNECFTLFESNRHLAKYPAEVEIALWFHDAVYDSKAQDNEARSANWAAEELTAAQVSQESIERVKQLIMATCHSVLPEGQDQQLLVDIDLSILGFSRHRFIEYETQVRGENQWVPGFYFAKSGVAFSRNFSLSTRSTIRLRFGEHLRIKHVIIWHTRLSSLVANTSL